MRYFGFLVRFVIIPLIGLNLLLRRDRQQSKGMPPELRNWAPNVVANSHVIAAVAYTTPWDNYIVANRVWWYDPKLVTGIVLGYVPLEEYTFFVLQTLLTSSWYKTLAHRLPQNDEPIGTPAGQKFRRWSTAALAVTWAAATASLATGWQQGKYMGLMLSWALPPIMLQTAFGGDILWKQRRLVALGIAVPTLYLSAADTLAIDAGTWTINPEKSLDVHIGGKLPVEEFLFFLITNTLISSGMTLVLSPESEQRLPAPMRSAIQRAKDYFASRRRAREHALVGTLERAREGQPYASA